MAEDDDYAIMPQKQIKEMKEELERLKKNPLGENATSADLLGAVDTLTHSIRDLMELFREASKGMKDEGTAADSKAFSDLNEKIDALIEQNKKIAKGIVTVADMLNKPQEEKPEKKPEPPPSPFGPDMPGLDSPFGAPPGAAPMGPPPPMGPPGAPPGPPPPPGFGPMPPPPSLPEEPKKGFFHKK